MRWRIGSDETEGCFAQGRHGPSAEAPWRPPGRHVLDIGLKARCETRRVGGGGQGRLGNGLIGQRREPVLVRGGRRYSQVNTGGRHTCAVTAAGRAFCWGNNTQGELGDGTTMTRLVPVAVATGLRFRRVTVDAAHTCGVTTEQRAYARGGDFSCAHPPVLGGRTGRARLQ